MTHARIWGAAVALAAGIVWGPQAHADEAAAKLDALYEQRDQPGAEAKNAAAVEEALKAAPESYDVLWRAARWHCWLADSWEPKQNPRREGEAKQCWDLGAKATAAKPDGVEGQYFAGDGVGQYSDEIGVVKALTQGLEGTFNGFVDKSLKLKPDFDNCDPYLLKGRYFYALPWPKRDLKKSEELLRKGIAACPGRVRLYAFLGDTLLKDGKAQEAKTVLEKGKAVGITGDAAEERRGMKLLEKSLKKVEEELK